MINISIKNNTLILVRKPYLKTLEELETFKMAFWKYFSQISKIEIKLVEPFSIIYILIMPRTV